jgi:hypothetical protein
MSEPQTPLDRLRLPFPDHQISKLPKPTKAQTDAVKADYKKGVRCKVCGTWHHPDVVHLDYVGHAALTDRLLDVDDTWSWEPVAFNQHGLPALDGNGGLWIRLTVAGVSRLGYGDADGKSGGNAVKEAIGDALRNAAMRFGAALDLWHKGDLHLEEDGERVPDIPVDHSQAMAGNGNAIPADELEPEGGWGDWARSLIGKVKAAATGDQLNRLRDDEKRRINAVKKHDQTMFNAIGTAFADARKIVLDDDVPF